MKKNKRPKNSTSIKTNAARSTPAAENTTSGKPARLELIEYGTTKTSLVDEPGHADWLPFFEKIALGAGGRFRTEIGAFELAYEFLADGTRLTLTKRKENSVLTARLITNALHLRGLRLFINQEKAKRWPIEKPSRASARVPGLIVNLSNVPADYTDDEREILRKIFAAAAFGLLRLFRKCKRGGGHMAALVALISTEPRLNFSAVKLPPLTAGSAR